MPFSFMMKDPSLCVRAILSAGGLLLLILGPTAIWAAGTIVTNPDRNLMIGVQDALPDDQGTRLLYYTSPGASQAHVREECSSNFYLLDLQPGLSGVKPQLLTENLRWEQGLRLCRYRGRRDMAISE